MTSNIAPGALVAYEGDEDELWIYVRHEINLERGFSANVFRSIRPIVGETNARNRFYYMGIESFRPIVKLEWQT